MALDQSNWQFDAIGSSWFKIFENGAAIGFQLVSSIIKPLQSLTNGIKRGEETLFELKKKKKVNIFS